jgi:hypothetical protein
MEPDIQGNDERPFGFGTTSKRTRTTSPGIVRRTMEDKRAEREKGKQERWSKIMENRKVDRDRTFMNDIFQDVPGFQSKANGTPLFFS